MDGSRSSHQVLKFAPAEELPRAYAFGPFRFDAHDRVLSREGVTVPLGPKPGELLLFFLRSDGRLLSKETLITSLWPDTFVEESSLSQTIFLLRKALGDHDFIDTVPRRGYRFTAPVEVLSSMREIATAPQRRRIAIAAAIVAVAVIGTLAYALSRPAPTVVAGEVLPARVDPVAREAYLKGRHYWNRRTPEDLHRAIDFFRAATEREPRFTLAWAGLADAYNLTGQHPRAIVAAERALELDESCAPAHAALGFAQLFHDYDFRGAERSFARSIELDPSYASARHWRAFLFLVQRRFEDARQEIEVARTLDPLSTIITTDVGAIRYYSRDYDGALTHYRRALDLDPTFLQASLAAGFVLVQKGDVRQAEKFFAERPSTPSTAAILSARGDRAGARAFLARVENEPDPVKRGASDYQMAAAYAFAGDADHALRWLERAYASRDGNLTLIHVDPDLDSIRGDARFVRFVRTKGLALP